MIINKTGRKIVYYIELDEIEIITEDEMGNTKYEMYFESFNKFLYVIKTSPRLVKVLKEKLEMIKKNE